MSNGQTLHKVHQYLECVQIHHSIVLSVRKTTHLNNFQTFCKPQPNILGLGMKMALPHLFFYKGKSSFRINIFFLAFPDTRNDSMNV